MFGPRLLAPVIPGVSAVWLRAACSLVALLVWYVPERRIDPTNWLASRGFVVWLLWSGLATALITVIGYERPTIFPA
jgi:hypothetical protein